MEDNKTIEALNEINDIADISFDQKNKDGLNAALKLCNKYDQEAINEVEVVYLNFIMANIYNYLSYAENNYKTKGYDLNNKYNERELFHLRYAMSLNSFNELLKKQPKLYFSILTNYANLLNFLGRTIEAIIQWNYCLEINPKFSMAQCNLALGLITYAYWLYDNEHRNIFRAKIKYLFKSALKGDISNEAREDIHRNLKYFTKIPSNKILLWLKNESKIGTSKQEIAYRNWVLKKELFLNPLNDLCKYSIAASDELHLPNMIDSIKIEKKSYFGFFNNLKQEFVSARFLFYESTDNYKFTPHFSDKGVLLYDVSIDFTLFNYDTEKLKYCFRSLYSIFDKIAYFINKYLNLEISDNKVDFSNVWYEKGNRRSGVFHNKIINSQNIFLRGLFWLHKDIYNNNDVSGYLTDPDAVKIKEIRNHLEHKYLKVHNSIWEKDKHILDDFRDKLSYDFRDKLSYDISIIEFERICLKLIKLVRASIISLSLMVKIEEDKFKEGLDEKEIAEIPIDIINDKYKIKF
ncbi:MAG: hypothetical protein CVV22_11640 [Ignavibacteriae bacterium HGW-Ignavibacteriae-1]|jgi:hypothetical protein|nr:MAG: hypothetical protein CVV22_11640 [Ignavibacteriae bacterium HGW-Ignavibacteriae-1]